MKRMKQLVNSFLLVVFACNWVMAQERILIRGTVTNKADKSETLVGVTVAETDRENRIVRGVQTDMNGNFSISVNNVVGEKLVFSYVGFQSQTVAIGNQAVVNVTLEEEAAQLGEVDIIGQRKITVGALSVDERDMTNAYSRLDAKDVDALPVSSIDEALQGRMAGVDIVANSGQPGSGMSIRIRGTTSINNNSDPLIVVNGIPYETNLTDDFDFATADEEMYSQLLNISPSDIQDITVLKDAASTAQYGSRGANGVLMIKTKRGAMGKPRLTYSVKGTLSIPRDAIPTLNGDEYSTLILEEHMNAGMPLNLTTYPEFARDPNNPYYFYNYGQNTDWVDLVQQNAFRHDHSFALSGGGQRAQYRISLGYLDEKGNLLETGYKRFTTTLDLNYNISDNLRVVARVSYTHGDRYAPFTNVLGNTYTKMPNQAVYQFAEDGTQMPVYFSPESTPQGQYSGGVYNPLAMTYHSSMDTKDDRVRPDFTIQYSIFPGVLQYQGVVSFDISTNKSKGFLPQIATGRPWTEATVNRTQESESESFIVQIQNMLTFTPKISSNVEFMGVARLNTNDRRSESFSGTTANSASIYLGDMSNPARIISVNSGLSQTRDMNGVFTAHWKFWDKYVIDGTLALEGNSKFGPGYRFGLFPSVSGRWRASSEPFLKDLKFLNDLSLRGSYGISGKAPGSSYLYMNRYNSFNYSYLGDVGIYPASMELKNLRWERSSEVNLGFNLIMWNNRINVDFDWYHKVTNDLMFSGVTIPDISGVSTINMNVGTLENNGWELSVFTTPVRSKDWQVDFRFTLSRTENMVTSLSKNIPLSATPTAANGNYLARIQENNPLGSFYGYRYKGVYLNADETIARDANGEKIYSYNEKGYPEAVQMQFWYPTNGYVFEAGDAKYEDINHDGNIDFMDIVYLGNANPILTGGFGPTIKYKRFSIEGYFYFRYGFDIINSTKMNMEKMHRFDNQSTAVLRRWRHPYNDPSEAPADLLPRALYNKGFNWLGSDRFVEDGSFLKFKSLTIRYAFNRDLLKKIGLTDLSVNFTAYNLYTWTKYTGMNPEVSARPSNSATGLYSIGYDNSKAPSNMDFSLGLNVTF
ncbi:MAG: SusC/RagA family TonB-linked outer membrane protein [Bacteroidales bacterium]|jgi:TonB-linked SusC/RagA family outer membrane protein|nr:SusC/RagA family TonB-linked outer membrane protein [Bacteroidales bacterium]